MRTIWLHQQIFALWCNLCCVGGKEGLQQVSPGAGCGQAEFHRKCDAHLVCPTAAGGAWAEFRWEAAHGVFPEFFLSSSSSGGPCKPTAWQVCIWWAKTASQASSPLYLSLLWVYIRSISAAAAAVWLHDLLVCSQWKIKRNGLEKQRRQN